MPTVVDISSAFGAYSVSGIYLLLLASSDFPVLYDAAIDPAVADVLIAVNVSGGPAVAITSAVADVLIAVDVQFATGIF